MSSGTRGHGMANIMRQRISTWAMSFNSCMVTTRIRTADPLRVRQMQRVQKRGLSGPHEPMAADDHQNSAAHAEES